MVHHIYCDESRQNNERYMILGGIIIPQNNVNKFNAAMNEYRNITNMKSELKWTKVANQKYTEYKHFVDYFFALNNTDNIHFKSLIIDNHKVNHSKYNSGDKELGFYKFYYQLLLHCFGKEYCYDKDDKFIIYLDHRNSKYPLPQLKKILNFGINKKYQITNNPFRSIEPKDSKKSELIQLNDIILGGIGFIKNGYHLLPTSRKAKVDLAHHIINEAGLTEEINDTPRNQRRFSIWNFKLRK